MSAILTVEIHRPPDGLIGLGQAAAVEKATRLAAWFARTADRGAQMTLTATRGPYLLLMWNEVDGGRQLQAVAHAESLTDPGAVEWHGAPVGAA